MENKIIHQGMGSDLMALCGEMKGISGVDQVKLTQFCRKFFREEPHETYERLAPAHSYETRKASVAWADVPANNKSLMVAVCGEILAKLDECQERA